MEILARAVGRRKEAIAQVQIIRGSGQIIINNIPASNYLHNNSSSLISMQSPYTIFTRGELYPDSANVLNVVTESTTILTQPNTQVHEGASTSNDSLRSQADADSTNASRIKPTGKTNLVSAAILPTEIASAGNEAPEGNKDITPINTNPYDTIVTVRGGGLVGQAEAIKLGIARALFIILNNNKNDLLKKELKSKGLLTQDSRVKERRKYGLRKARKASQYHKR